MSTCARPGFVGALISAAALSAVSPTAARPNASAPGAASPGILAAGTSAGENESELALSTEDRQKLLSWRSITRSAKFRRNGRNYIMGISYQLVEMPPGELFSLMQNVSHTLPRALPATHQARVVGEQGELPLVEVVHGNSFINGQYTVVWQALPGESEIRFWLDPTRPHDLRDIWGYFRIVPFGSRQQSMVTVAVALDLGGGATQRLYESKVRKIILKSARYIRKFVKRRRKAEAG